MSERMNAFGESVKEFSKSHQIKCLTSDRTNIHVMTPTAVRGNLEILFHSVITIPPGAYPPSDCI